MTQALRWFVGVPILTNAVILIEVLLFVALLWLLAAFGVLAIQWIVAGSPALALPAAVSFACTLSASFALLFAAIVLLFYRNRYIALYNLDGDSISCESMMNWQGGIGESFHMRPFFVEPCYVPHRSVTKKIYWPDVTRVEPIGNMRTLILRGGARKKSVLMRVYCPDDECYERALEAIKRRIEER